MGANLTTDRFVKMKKDEKARNQNGTKIGFQSELSVKKRFRIDQILLLLGVLTPSVR